MKNDLFSIGPFTIHGYGLMMAIGILTAYYMVEYRAKKKGMEYEKIFSLAIWAVVGGLLGAKILYLLTRLPDIAADPSLILHSLKDGFVVYGSIIGGVAAAWLYCKKSRMDFLKVFDLVVPSLALAQGIGRIGCLLAGCCHGGETDAWYGIPMDIGVRDGVYVKVVPLQLFEAIFLFALAAFIIARVWKGKGLEAPVYLIGYGIWRFVIEFFRTDDRGASLIPGLSPSQVTAIFMILVGAAIYIGYSVICSRKGRGFFSVPAQAAESGSATGDPSLKNGSAAEVPAPQSGAFANADSKEESAAAQESRTDKSDR